MKKVMTKKKKLQEKHQINLKPKNKRKLSFRHTKMEIANLLVK